MGVLQKLRGEHNEMDVLKAKWRKLTRDHFPTKKRLTRSCPPTARWGWVQRLRLLGSVLRERTKTDHREGTLSGIT